MKGKSLLFLIPVAAMVLAGCQNNSDEGKLPEEEHEESHNKQFEGITLESSKEVYYDGENHSLTLSGVPEGATVVYEGAHEFKEIGEHNVKVTISQEGYDPLTLEGTLNILALLKFEGVSLQSDEIYYDGEAHSLELVGVPEGASVAYEGDHEFTDVGVHDVKVSISKEHYETLVLEGSLTILALNEFTGVSLESAEIYYDGAAHSLELIGVPEGATVTYQGDYEFTEVGVHTVQVTISKYGYVSKTLQGTLTIKALEQFEGLTFVDTSVTYDGEAHKIEVGNLPEGASVVYDVEPVRPGVYTQKATVSKENYEDKELSAKLTITLEKNTNPQIIDDFEGIGDSDLGSDWTLEYYNNGWVVPQSASIKVANNGVFGEGSGTMRMNLSHQGSSFKVTKDIQLDSKVKSFNGIKLDVMYDKTQESGSMTGKVQLWFKDLPLPEAYKGYANTYITYTLNENLKTNWTHYEIPFNDSSISIAGGAIPLEALSQLGLTFEEMSLYIDKVAVLMTPNFVSGGPKAYAYVDNIKLDNVNSRVEEEKVNFENRVWTVTSTDSTDYKLEVGKDGAAKLSSLNLESNFSFNGTVSASENLLSLTIPTGGEKSVVIPLNASKNGSVLEIGSPRGDLEALASYAEHLVFELDFEEVVKIDDFESYSETGVGLDQTHTEEQMSGLRAAYHSDYYAGSGSHTSLIGDPQWQLMGSTDYLNLSTEAHSGSKSGDFKGSGNQMRYVSFGLAKGTGVPYGRGRQLSFWVKSTVATTLKAKAYYVEKISATNQGAESGDAVSKANIEIATDKWTQVTIDLDAKREIYGIDLIPAKTAARIYVDDIELIGSTNPWSEFVPEPEIETIEDGLFGVVAGGKGYSLEVSNNVTEAAFGELGSEPTAFTAEMAEGKVTFKDKEYAGAGVTLVTSIVDGKLRVDSATGAGASAFTPFIGGSLEKYLPMSVDFQNEKSGGQIADNHWVAKKYTDSWVDAGKMNIRNSGSNIFANMPCGYSMDYTYTYTPDLKIGPANHFEVDIANDFDGAQEIKVKVKVIKTDGTDAYIMGDGSNYVSIPAGTGSRSGSWYHVEQDFDLTDVKAVKFIVKSAMSGNAYLYVDNIKVGFKSATPSPIPEVNTVSDGRYYIWNSASDAFIVDLSSDVTAAVLTKAETSTTFNGTASQSDGVLTINVPNMLTVKATINDDGGFTITEVSGNAASLVSSSLLNKTAKAAVCPNLTFEDGKGSDGYVSSDWKVQKYTSTWEDVDQSKAMNSRSISGNKIVNLVAGTNARNFIYSPGSSFGPVNHLDVDLGNYYSAAKDIKIKIKVLDANDNVKAILTSGGADEWQTISYSSTTNVLNKFSFDFTMCVGYKLRISTQSSVDSTYLYMDNLVFSCVAK